MASLLGRAVAGCERFRDVPIRSVPVEVGLSVMLNVAAGEGVSHVSGGNIKERELLIEQSHHREKGGSSFIKFMAFYYISIDSERVLPRFILFTIYFSIISLFKWYCKYSLVMSLNS